MLKSQIPTLGVYSLLGFFNHEGSFLFLFSFFSQDEVQKLALDLINDIGGCMSEVMLI